MWMDEVPSFSEQQIVDCSLVPNFGCMGGDPKHAFSYVREHGLANTSDYPYEDKLGSCRYDTDSMQAFKVEEFKIFSYPLNTDLKKLVCQGSVSTGFFINECIKNYAGGIIKDNEGQCGCSDLQTTNHAVAIVGFGVDGMAKQCKKYWIVKNSWGSEWGEQGFMRVCREDDEMPLGTCSIRSEVVLPISGSFTESGKDGSPTVETN